MKQLKLTIEESELLEEILDSDGFKAFLKAADSLVSDQERAVLKASLDAGEKQLVYAKLRAEGARKLHSDLSQLKAFLKGKRSEP